MASPPDPRPQRPGVSQIGEAVTGNLARFYINGQIEDSGIASVDLAIPDADLLGGDGTDFTSVTVGAGLSISAGTLSAAVPTVRTVSGTTDTILAADRGNAVRYTNAAAIAVTVPAGLGAGFTCLLLQLGAGAFTVAGSGATILNRQSQTASAGQGAVCSLFADAANHLLFAGDTA